MTKGPMKNILSQQPHWNENKTPRHKVIQGNKKPLKKKIQAIEADGRREKGSWSKIISFVKWSFIKSTYRFRAILM